MRTPAHVLPKYDPPFREMAALPDVTSTREVMVGPKPNPAAEADAKACNWRRFAEPATGRYDALVETSVALMFEKVAVVPPSDRLPEEKPSTTIVALAEPATVTAATAPEIKIDEVRIAKLPGQSPA
jgi:hypothetical protein